MTCDRRLLSYYRDGSLSLEDRYDVECHLAVCADCTAALRSLMRMAQVIRSLPMEPVPTSIRENVRRLVAEREQEQRKPIQLGAFGRALAPAAVAASIAISTIVVFRPGSLDLPNRPAPAAITSQTTGDQPSMQPAASVPQAPAAQSSTASAAPGNPQVPSRGPRQPMMPVSQSGSDSLPTKLVNPSVVPEPIARLHSSNAQVHDMLGEASPGSRTVTLLEQSFQGGLAIWRSDTREIYVLRRDGNTWSVHTDVSRPGERVAADTAPPPGAMVPAGGFGTVWRSTPEIKNRLGWAVYEPRGSGGLIQTFEHGLIVWTPHGLLYVLSNDGRWRTFPDASPL